MIRRFAPLALIALLLAAPLDAMAREAANYEISSYVLYMTVQEDGDVRLREEIIYNNPGAYAGLDLPVSLDGSDGLADVAVWRDGEALEELPAADARLGEGEGCMASSSSWAWVSFLARIWAARSSMARLVEQPWARAMMESSRARRIRPMRMPR